jgi:hypothetical protein
MSESDPSNRFRLFGDLALAGFLYLVVTFGFGASYSSTTFDPIRFDAQYRHGVYAPRILGTTAIAGLHWILARVLGPHANFLGTHYGAMFTPLVIGNGIAFAGVALALRTIVRDVPESAQLRDLVFVLGLVTCALTLYVVTPYDMLALFIMLVSLRQATRTPPWDLLAIPLAVAGVLTRETEFLAVAAMVAIASLCKSAVRISVALGAVVATAIAYVVVHQLTAGANQSSYVQSIGPHLQHNLRSANSLTGVAIALAGSLWWRGLVVRRLNQSMPEGGRATTRVVTRRFWLMSLPYLFVVVLATNWFESLRLVVPLLWCDLWVRLQPNQVAKGQRALLAEEPPL